MYESANDEISESIESITDNLIQWYPHDILRRTNWLYRMDSLRNHDVREMSLLWEITELFQDYATSFLVWHAEEPPRDCMHVPGTMYIINKSALMAKPALYVVPGFSANYPSRWFSRRFSSFVI